MRHLLLVTLLLCNHIYSEGQTNKLNELKWLQGEWVMDGGDVQFAEYWYVVNETQWHGAGHAINAKGDTLFREDLQIALQNDTVWYLPTVANQNEGKQVRFAATELTDRKAVFENRQHDFPQRIVYIKTSNSAIYTYVEGVQNGKIRKEEFYFKRK